MATDGNECDCVVVTRSLDPNAERIKLPTNADNTLGLQTLKGAFPGAHGLKYKNPATGAFRGLLIDRTKFRPPPGGWANKEFVAISPPTISREQANVPKYIPTTFQPKHTPDEYTSRVLPYLFRFQRSTSGTKMSASGTAFAEKLIATCAHVLFGLDDYEKCNPSKILPPNNTYYTATDMHGKEFKLLLIAFEPANDLAILKCEEQLVVNPPFTDCPFYPSFHYMILGYPDYNGFKNNSSGPKKRDEGNHAAWSILEGMVAHQANEGCYVGQGGASPGLSGGPIVSHEHLRNYYSGAPAIDLDNLRPSLFGICRGGAKGENVGTVPIVHIIPMLVILHELHKVVFEDEKKEEKEKKEKEKEEKEKKEKEKRAKKNAKKREKRRMKGNAIGDTKESP